MSIKIVKFEYVDQQGQQDIAEYVSAYTNGQLGELPQMLAVTQKDVTEKHLGYVAFSGDAFAGYIGAKTPESWQGGLMSEVGSLLTVSEFRKQGIAHMLAGAISLDLKQSGVLPYAFCNNLSLPIFTSLGYEPTAPEQIPASAFSACQGCPAKPQNGCCDTALTLKGDTV